MSSKRETCGKTEPILTAVRVAIACVWLAACRGEDKPAKPEQSEHDAVALLCGAQPAPSRDPALHDWLAQQVTNPHIRHFLDGIAEEFPWDIEKQIEKLGRDAAVSPCHPLEGLAGIRARNGIDVPLLADARGTVSLEEGPTIAITPARVTIESVGSFDIARLDEMRAHVPALDGPSVTRFAVDRNVTFRTLRDVMGEFAQLGVHHSNLVVTTPDEARAVVLALPKAQASTGATQSMAAINLGAMLRFNGEQVTFDGLRSRIASSKPDQIFVIPEPDVTVQRLAEALAITGDRTYLGDALLPHVEPAPRQR